MLSHGPKVITHAASTSRGAVMSGNLRDRNVIFVLNSWYGIIKIKRGSEATSVEILKGTSYL